jgi:hypothetical protein
MMASRFQLRAFALAAGLLAASAVGASAQAPVDSAGIARGIARFVAAEIVPEFRVKTVAAAPAETRFDSLVAAELALLPEFQRPVADSATVFEVGTRGLLAEMPYPPDSLRGLPAVVVFVTACERSEDWGGKGHWWISQEYYVLKRTERGWEVVGGRTLDNADGRCDPDEDP